MIAVGNG